MKALCRKLALAFSCAAAATVVTATEFFASPDAVDGETTDCLTEATAGTFTNAMAHATADGDVVTLLPGTGGIYDFTVFTPYAKTAVVNVSSKSYFVGNKDVGTSAAGACFNVAMTNCLVYGNETIGGSYGGSTVYSTKPVVNCTIVSNTVPPAYAACVGNFVNCIIADNGPYDVWGRSELETTLTNCIYGTVKGTTVSNICGSVHVASTAAIKFESTDIADANAYVPQYPSPARDAGRDVGLTAADRDLAGRKRVKGMGIDIGCYECIGSGGLLLHVR